MSCGKGVGFDVLGVLLQPLAIALKKIQTQWPAQIRTGHNKGAYPIRAKVAAYKLGQTIKIVVNLNIKADDPLLGIARTLWPIQGNSVLS